MTSPSGTVLLFVGQWEFECCGTPLAVGDVVDLLLLCHDGDAEPVWRVSGEPVTMTGGHHERGGEVAHVRARVERLWEARAHREQRPGDAAWYLVEDSGEIHEITSMKVAEADWQPARAGGRPEVWIVQATVLTHLPHPGDAQGAAD